MTGTTRAGRNGHGSKGLIPLAVLAVCLLITLASPARSCAQSPAYAYRSFDSDITINADGSLLVRDTASYIFEGEREWVGLTVPAAYGRVGEARVLDAAGNLMPEGGWSLNKTGEATIMRCYTGDAGSEITVIYEYSLYDSLSSQGALVGMEWGAVPEGRDAPILASSVTLHFPGSVDPDAARLEAYAVNHAGEISKRFVGGNTAVIETEALSADASYSFSCYWPASMMALDPSQLPAAAAGESPAQGKSWDFERFDVDIQVNPDSSFTVRETQVANFRGSFTHLNRDLSEEGGYFTEGRTYGRVRVHDIAVYYLDGNPYPSDLWRVSSYAGGKRVTIDFAAEDEQSGWVVEYRMTGAIIFADRYDRLYWNAVPVDRGVPIKSSRVTAHLPPGAEMNKVETEIYTDTATPPGGYELGREAYTLWWEVENVPAYTTFSIDVSFPKGLVGVPWLYTSACLAIAASFCGLLVLGVLFLMLRLWWRKGRDVGRSGAIIVRYDPPEGLKPAMLGMLVNEKPRVEDISATVVDLARRGKLAIVEEERRSLIRVTRFGFRRLSHDDSDLLPYEREVMDGLFEAGDAVSEKDLTDAFYTHVKPVQDGVKEEVMQRRLFNSDPQKVRHRYLLLGTFLALLPSLAVFYLFSRLDLGWLAVLPAGFIPAGLVVCIVGAFMPSRSPEGSLAFEHAMGYKDFLETAEKPEIEHMTPEDFQANLPYAMVLGVAGNWAGKFKDIYTTPPDWYQGTYTAFNAVYLTDSLARMTGNLGRTLTSSPSDSSSGGGFGGGFSGGGFGGGGSSAG